LIDITKAEVSAFLHEMKAEGLFNSEEELLDRLGAVLDVIQNGAVAPQVWRDSLESDEITTVKVDGISTKEWVQNTRYVVWGPSIRRICNLH
jgi:hypothetical protein